MGTAALLLILLSCGSPDEKAAKAVARYDIYFARGDFYSARIEIKRAIGVQEGAPDYWVRLARVELATGNYQEAYAAYSRASELDTNNGEAIQALAELAFSGGSLDDAEKFADRMLREQPTLLRMLLVKASVAISRGKADEAQLIADKMIAIDPTNEGAQILRARILDMKGDLPGAIDILEKAIVAGGESVPKLMALLDLYTGRNDFKGSARTFARLFTLLPDNVDIRLAYARQLYEQGRPDRALDFLARLTRRHPRDVGLAERIVDMWKDVGSEVVDVDRVGRFVAASGDNQMKVAFGHLLIDQKRFAEAERALQPFADRDGITADNIDADVLYAQALLGLGRSGEALKLVDKLLLFDPSNSDALLTRVRISVANGDLDQALRDAQSLATDSPRVTAGRIALGEIYEQRRSNILANAAYGQAMRDLPDDSKMLAAYANYLVRDGRGPIALGVARKFTEQNPRMREGWRERARLCIRLNDGACVQDVFAALDRLPGGRPVRRALEAQWKAARPSSGGTKKDAGTSGARTS